MSSIKRHERYQTFGGLTFAEADEELRRYWRFKTPAADWNLPKPTPGGWKRPLMACSKDD